MSRFHLYKINYFKEMKNLHLYMENSSIKYSIKYNVYKTQINYQKKVK